MVKKLSKADTDALTEAVAEAERNTSAELVTVIAPASDTYQSFILLYGLLLGSVAAGGLWLAHIVTSFPVLFTVQIATISVLSLIPFLRSVCIGFIPARIKHQRAARRTFEEYIMVTRQLPASTPVLLFYVSLAERYAHILPSRSVREKIPEEKWSVVVQEFISLVSTAGLRDGCIRSVKTCSELLSVHFPEQGETHLAPNVIEIRK